MYIVTNNIQKYKAKWYFYKVIYLTHLQKSRKWYSEKIQLSESFRSLSKRIRIISRNEFEKKLQVEHLQNICKYNSLLCVIQNHGEPFLIKRKKIQYNFTHYIVVYKKRIWQSRTRITYHFVNQHFVSVNFMFRIKDASKYDFLKKQLINHLGLPVNESLGNNIFQYNDNLIELDYNQDLNLFIYPKHQRSIEMIKELSQYL